MKRTVLFVDDEPNVLSGLRRMLRRQTKQWNLLFAGDGNAAIDVMQNADVDVIVSDMRMPGMGGAELLHRVSQNYPGTVRIVLSGQSSQEKIFRAIGPAHQFLSKPCDADLLVNTIDCACNLQSTLSNETLHTVVSRIESLPALPRLYRQLVELLETDDASLDDVGEIIGSDLAMSAKVLQWVNSSFFGLPQHVACPKQAVGLLGLGVIRPLTLTAGAFGHFESVPKQLFCIERAIGHGLSVATRARQIAIASCEESPDTDPNVVDDAFIAGMLHDIGKLVLASYFSDDYQSVNEIIAKEGRNTHEAESEVFGVSHAEVGAHLLAMWGLPDSIVEATAFHHLPELSLEPPFRALTAVHEANETRHLLENELESVS